jgi:hypothetical protein
MSAMSKIISGSKPVVFMRNSTSSYSNQQEEEKFNGEVFDNLKASKDGSGEAKDCTNNQPEIFKYIPDEG